MEKDGFYLLSNENYFRKQFHCSSPVLTNESLCSIFVHDVLYKELANTNAQIVVKAPTLLQFWASRVALPGEGSTVQAAHRHHWF